jgi:hypothetical protein
MESLASAVLAGYLTHKESIIMNMLNQNLNNPAIIPANTVVYGLTDLAAVPAGHAIKAGYREVRIIVKSQKDKEGNVIDTGLVSQYCQLPEVSHGFATAFTNSERGMALVMDYIASLQNKAVSNVYREFKRSPTEHDVSMEALFELGAAESVTVRVTKESCAAWFELNKGSIASFLASSRGVAIDSDGFWNSEQGLQFIKIAMNYKPLIVSLAERKPAFKDEVKAKIELVFANVMSGTALEEKMLEKLQAATLPVIDELGL